MSVISRSLLVQFEAARTIARCCIFDIFGVCTVRTALFSLFDALNRQRTALLGLVTLSSIYFIDICSVASAKISPLSSSVKSFFRHIFFTFEVSDSSFLAFFISYEQFLSRLMLYLNAIEEGHCQCLRRFTFTFCDFLSF